VIAVAFQSVFHSEIYQNDIFLIFKKLFLKSAHQNIKKLIFRKTKLNFLETLPGVFCTAFPKILIFFYLK
jgi:hypothetical protein